MKFYLYAAHGEFEVIDEMLEKEFNSTLEHEGFLHVRVITVDSLDDLMNLHDRLETLYQKTDSGYRGLIIENDTLGESKYPTLMIYDGYME